MKTLKSSILDAVLTALAALLIFVMVTACTNQNVVTDPNATTGTSVSVANRTCSCTRHSGAEFSERYRPELG